MAKKTPSAALSDVRNVVVGSKATAQSTFQPGAPASDAVPAKATLSNNLKKKIVSDSDEYADTPVPADAHADVVLAQLTPAPAAPAVPAAAAAPAAAGAAPAAAVTAAEVTTVVAPTQVGAIAAVAGGFSPVTLAVAGAGLALGGGGGGGSAPAPAPDTTAPTLVITDDEPVLRANVAGGDIVYTFTFSEAVTGFDVSDITVTNGFKGTFTAVSATVYTLVVTPAAGFAGNVTVDVVGGAARDNANNLSIAATQSVQAVDMVSPTVVIADNAVGTVTGGDVIYTFTFSESVTGFSASDITVANGIKGAFNEVSATVYTLAVTPAAGFTGNVVVDVAAGAASSVAGNLNVAAVQSVLPVQMIAPTVVITDDEPGTGGLTGGNVVYTFTFSEAVTGFTAADIAVSNGTKGTFTAVSSTVYTLAVTPTAAFTGNVTVDVAAGAATSSTTGNLSAAATQSLQAVDMVAPTVVITDDEPGTGKVAGGDIIYTFTFAEPVTGFTAADVTVANGTKGTFTAVSSTVYTLAVAPTPGFAGNMTVDVAAGVATDIAGNLSIAAVQSVQPVEMIVPTVVITDDEAGTATVSGGNVIYTFTFSEAVTGFTAGDVTVVHGTKGTFTAVSSTVYTLAVTPEANYSGNMTVDVAASAATSIATGNSSAAATQSVQVVDTGVPTVVITDDEPGTGTITGGDITYTFTFSTPVTGFSAGDITVVNGAKGTFTAVSSSVYTLVVTPTEGFQGNVTVDVAANAASSIATGNLSTAATQSVQAVDMNTWVVSGSIVNKTVNLGNMGDSLGNNTSINVTGDVINSTLHFGSGDNNHMYVGGSIINAPDTVTFGDGDGNTLDVDGDIMGSTVTMGDGDGNSITVGGVVNGSTITQGDGSGSIEFGPMSNNDSATLVGYGGPATLVDLGGGNDSATINGTDGGSATLIISGATLEGGEGDDTLTINGVDDIDVIARTHAQQAMVTLENTLERGDTVSVTVGEDTYTEVVEYTQVQVVTLDFTGTYVAGQEVSVTVGSDTYTFTMPAMPDSIEQGGATAYDTDNMLAQGLYDAMILAGVEDAYGFDVVLSGTVITMTGDNADLNADNVDVESADADITDNGALRSVTTMNTVGNNLEAQIDNDGAGFSADYAGGELTISADSIAADVQITAEIIRADESTQDLGVEVLQIANASISGFETLELVAQAIDAFGSDDAGADFTANFDLISDVTNINLVSELDRVEADHEGVDGYDQGDDVTFNLQNLHGGESITVSGNEASATGNPLGARIVVGNGNGDHLVGDKITVTLGENEYVYTVTLEDLSAATAQLDANNIAANLADFIQDAADQEGVTLTLDANVITLVGNDPGQSFWFSVQHNREATHVVNSDVSVDWNAGWMIGEADYREGDVLSVDMGEGVVVSYTITAADLDTNCDRSVSERLAEGLAAAFGDDNVLALRGVVTSADYDGQPVVLSRTGQDWVGNTSSGYDQIPTNTDDSYIDVTVNAYLSAEADTANDTLTLTVDGTGNFDLLLLGEDGNLVEQNSYEATDLHVADSFSHYIDTNTNAGDVITLTGGAEGADIYLDRVDAHTVDASGTQANLTIDQGLYVDGYYDSDWNYYPSHYTSRLSGEEDLHITTGTGDDTLITSADAALRAGSSIDLGDGENRLSLIWDADTVYSGLSLPLLMSSQFGSDEVTLSFDTESGTIGDVIDANTPIIFTGSDTKIEGRLQTTDDIDMFAVELVAGNTYQFSMFGDVNNSDDIGADYSLYNPYLTLLDAAGNEITLNDNDGHNLNSIILFTATESGTFYLKAASYNAESSGTYAIEVVDRTSEIGSVPDPLADLANMNFSGHLHQLDLMTDVVLAEDSVTLLTMPGEDGQVEVLTFNSINVDDRGVDYGVDYLGWIDNYTGNASADLTISGTASTLEIIANNIGDFGEEFFGEDQETVVLEALGVENLTLTSNSDVNVVINGDDLKTLLVVTDNDDARVVLNGVRGGVADNADPADAVQDQLLSLESITVSAEDGSEVYIDQIRTGASLTVVADSSGSAGDAVVDISYAELGDVSVTYSPDDNAYVYINDTVNSTLTLGNLSVLDRVSDGSWYESYADVSINRNSDSVVTIGDIIVSASSDASLSINDNDSATLNLGSLHLESRSYGQATLQISDNDNANITFNGTVTVRAESDAEFSITANDTYGPGSTIETGDVYLTSCASDALVGIENNGDYADEGDLIIRLGNVTLDGASDAVVSVGDDSGNNDVTVQIGDITATAGTWQISDADAAVYVMNNSDSNISIGNISLTAYGDYSSQAVVRMDDNDNTTVTTGSIVAVANGDGAEAELHMDSNDSDSVITIGGDVTLTSSDYTYLHVYGNSDNTHMTIEGNVLMSAASDSYVNIQNNSDSHLTIEGNVTLNAGDDSLNDNQANGNAHFNVSGNSDSSFTITGDLSLNGVNTGLFIEDNQSSGFYAGAVSLTSTDNVVGSDGIESYDADVLLDNNDCSTVRMDSLSVSAESDYALLMVSDNNYSEITITGDVLIASGSLGSDSVSGYGFASLIVADNSDSNVALGVVYGDDDVTVIERNAVSVSGNDSAYLEVSNNDNSVVDMGNITVASGSSDAEVNFFWNDGNSNVDTMVISTGSIDITAFGDGNNSANALFEVSDNSYADITVNGDINVTGLDARFDINDGDVVHLSITGNVTTTSSGNYNADVVIDNNDGSRIDILGEQGLTISAGSDSASLNVEDNDETLVSLANNVTLTAENATSVIIDNNDDASTVYLGVGLDSGGIPLSGSDGAEFKQVTLTGGGNTYFSISDNDSGTDVYVGNLSLTSTGSDVEVAIVYNNAWLGCDADSSNISVGDVVIGADVDVDLDIHAGGDDTFITAGTFDIEAGDDVYFDVSNTYGSDASVTLGDTIDITAGMSNDTSSVYFDLDDVNGAKDITIDMSGSLDSYVYVDIIDSGDVETLTVSGSDADIYIEGDSDAFRTLDIQNVGTAYVETWNADFRDGNDALNYADRVTVLIGTGDVQYNAWYGDGEDSDWSGNDGWYSLGAGQDFTPYPQVQTLTNFAEYSYNVDNDYNWGIFYNTMQFDQSGTSYRVQVEMGRYEGDGEADGNDALAYTTDINYFTLQSGSWVELSQGQLEDALGIESFSYTRYTDSAWGEFNLTGLADGTTFDAVRDAAQVLTADLEDWSYGWASINNERTSNVAQVDDNIDIFSTNSSPDLATDGVGNLVAEIFTFTGDTIGDIVIGGFVASPYASEDGRWADKLDFSGFLGTDLNSTTEDMTFAVVDGDGYFKDVIIDFINEDYGSIRLVGAGEYNGTELELLNRVAASVIFA